MNVDRGYLADAGGYLVEQLAVDGAQRVRRNADCTVGIVGRRAAQRIDDVDEPVRVVEETPLPGQGIGAAEAAVAVQHRQRGKTDADAARRRETLQAHLGALGVRLAVDAVVQILEFADRAVTRPEHFEVELRGDML